MKIKNILMISAAVLAFSSCDDLFVPAVENVKGDDVIFSRPSDAMGMLGYAYAILPFETKSTTDIATDDAVTNDLGNSLRAMAQGSWSSVNDPVTQWQARKATIQYLNIFLKNHDQVTWTSKPHVQQMFQDHVRGEALGLRALNMYYLLRNHGGWTAGGELLGVPCLTEPEGAGSDFNVPRDSFQKCVEQICADLDEAIELLPLDYANLTSDSQVPKKYTDLVEPGYTGIAQEYNTVFGTYMSGRVTARICEAIKAQVLLLASSPAFAEGTEVTSADAADAAAAVLDRIGGVAGMDPTGHRWFMEKNYIDNMGSGAVPPEIIWRGNRTNGTADYDFGLQQEKDNFPPTLYGNGRINPTQNFVDAFPMANGYPISNGASGYNANDPYAGRDPRLSEYVIYNGTVYAETEIITGAYGTDNNALNRISQSTRTGYYLKKLLRDDVNPNPSSTNAKYHYPVYMRYTEIFLAYAEAANEAWGPHGKGSHGYSAYDVIKAIRSRAGIAADGTDAYLESCAGSKDAMRQLIRNERRIELSFENKRFWDLRRWKANLNETAKGVRITQSGGVLQYNVIDVENRNYRDYMYYGPIPQGEELKWSNLEQNLGW